jgi:hypothetical protein
MLLKTQIVYGTTELIIFSLVVLAVLFAVLYFVQSAAVKNGTKELLEELRKRRP